MCGKALQLRFVFTLHCDVFFVRSQLGYLFVVTFFMTLELGYVLVRLNYVWK